MGKPTANNKDIRSRPNHRRRPSVLPADLLFSPSENPTNMSDENSLIPTEDPFIPNENDLIPAADNALTPAGLNDLVSTEETLTQNENELIPPQNVPIPNVNVFAPIDDPFIPTEIDLFPVGSDFILGGIPDSKANSDNEVEVDADDYGGDFTDEDELRLIVLDQLQNIYAKRQIELLTMCGLEELRREILEITAELEKLRKNASGSDSDA